MKSVITRSEFNKKYSKRHIVQKHAAAGYKEDLLNEIFATEYPVYLDRTHDLQEDSDVLYLKDRSDIPYLSGYKPYIWLDLYEDLVEHKKAWLLYGTI